MEYITEIGGIVVEVGEIGLVVGVVDEHDGQLKKQIIVTVSQFQRTLGVRVRDYLITSDKCGQSLACTLGRNRLSITF